MAKLTFKVALDEVSWTAIASGDTYNSFGLMCLSGSAKVLIANSAPARTDDDWIPISASDSREITMSLPAGYTLYAQAKVEDTVVAGFKVPAS